MSGLSVCDNRGCADREKVVLIAAGGWHEDAPSGANRLPTEFARYLITRGRRVAYLCPSRRVSCPNPELCDGVEVYRYSFPGASSPSVTNLFAHLYRSRSIAAGIASCSPIEALLGHAPLQYLGALSGCHPTRKCYAVHSPFHAELQSNRSEPPRLEERLAGALSRWLEAGIFSRSDLVHCFSQYMLNCLRNKIDHPGVGKYMVLPAWVDTDRFKPSWETRQQVRRRLGEPWDPETVTFFTVRRLVPRMGMDALLEATAILSEENYMFKVIIAGEGPELPRLRDKCLALSLQGRVAFLGRVPEEQLVDVFRAGDCFVLPTRFLEGFGLIILEAYACGTPVIAVPVGAIPEVLGSSLQHWLAHDNSPSAIAERMRDFLTRRLVADRDRLRRRALEFDFQAVAALHERQLLEVLPDSVPTSPMVIHKSNYL